MLAATCRTRRAAVALITVASPPALFIALGSELWVRWAFGAEFAPAASSLRFLAPLFLVTYVNGLLSQTLIVRRRGWSLTASSLAGVLANPAIAVFAVPLCLRALGDGGGGVGSALGMVGGELVVCLSLLVRMPAGTVDRTVVSPLLRTLLTAAFTVALHVALAPLGHLRLLLDAATYVTLGLILGALKPREMYAMARELISSRKG